MIPEPNTGCWLWTGTSRNGYGRFIWDGNAYTAHRVAYQILKGPVPPHLMVLHRCDTPACINPDHLFLGTQSDNMRDASRKGRLFTLLRGGWNPNQKLSHCKRGHPFTDGSYYAHLDKRGNLIRQCKECAKIHDRKRKATIKAARQARCATT